VSGRDGDRDGCFDILRRVPAIVSGSPRPHRICAVRNGIRNRLGGGGLGSEQRWYRLRITPFSEAGPSRNGVLGVPRGCRTLDQRIPRSGGCHRNRAGCDHQRRNILWDHVQGQMLSLLSGAVAVLGNHHGNWKPVLLCAGIFSKRSRDASRNQPSPLCPCMARRRWAIYEITRWLCLPVRNFETFPWAMSGFVFSLVRFCRPSSS